MKQRVRFKTPGELGTLRFRVGPTYTFTVENGWIIYYGKRRTSLSAFANWFTDTGHAEFLDAA